LGQGVFPKTHDRIPVNLADLCSDSISASVLFTNYDLIWFQIHEMLRIEKGGQEQVKDELEAYKDMIRMPASNAFC
jgi:hypothetical protein